MTIILELPPSVEVALAQEAARRGTTPELLLAEDALRKYSALKTGADLLDIWRNEGVFLPTDEREEHQARARQIRESEGRIRS